MIRGFKTQTAYQAPEGGAAYAALKTATFYRLNRF